MVSGAGSRSPLDVLWDIRVATGCRGCGGEDI